MIEHLEKIYLSLGQTSAGHIEDLCDQNKDQLGTFSQTSEKTSEYDFVSDKEFHPFLYQIDPTSQNFSLFQNCFSSDSFENLDSYFNTDVINAIGFLSHSPNIEMTLSLRIDSDLIWFENIFKSCIKSSAPYKNNGAGYQKIELQISHPISDQTIIELFRFKDFIERTSKSHDPLIIAKILGPDLANLYQIAKSILTQNYQNWSDIIVDKMVLGGNKPEHLSELDAFPFDFYARHTSIKSILGISGYRALIRAGLDQKVAYQDLAKLAGIDQQSSPLVSTVQRIDNRDRETLKTILMHFQKETHYTEIVKDDTTLKAFIDAKSNLVILEFYSKSTEEPIILRAKNESYPIALESVGTTNMPEDLKTKYTLMLVVLREHLNLLDDELKEAWLSTFDRGVLI